MVAPRSASLHDRVAAAAADLAARVPGPFAAGWLAEGGLGALEEVADPAPVAARDLDGFGSGAAGRFLALQVGGRRVLAFEGGPLLAEGGDPEEIAFPVWLFRKLGSTVLVVTGGAGALDPSLEPPRILGVDDHLNFSGASPLRGPLDERMGPRFPDLARVYDEEWLAIAEREASLHGIPFRRGVLAATAGPTFETAAERAFYRLAGAHAVAQSMVVPALAGAHAGLRTLALAAVVEPHRGREVYADPATMVRRAAAASGQLARLLDRFVASLPEEGAP